MAKLPPIKRFLTEDFPKQADWIGNLFYPLNLLITTIYGALNNGITLKENCMTQVKTLSVTGASPSVSFPYQYSPQIPIGIVIASVVQTNTPAVTLTVAVGCQFTVSSGVITATVKGLDASSVYDVTFIVWGG